MPRRQLYYEDGVPLDVQQMEFTMATLDAWNYDKTNTNAEVADAAVQTLETMADQVSEEPQIEPYQTTEAAQEPKGDAPERENATRPIQANTLRTSESSSASLDDKEWPGLPKKEHCPPARKIQPRRGGVPSDVSCNDERLNETEWPSLPKKK